MKEAITFLFSGIFLLGLVSQVQAIPITVNATFSDGGTVSGTIEVRLGGVGGANRVTDWNLMTSGGSLPDFTYDMNTSTDGIDTNSQTRFDSNSSNRILRLFWDPNLNQTSTGPLALEANSAERLGNITRFASGGAAVSTPEPGTILLFGSGLLGLGLWRYRKNVKS